MKTSFIGAKQSWNQQVAILCLMGGLFRTAFGLASSTPILPAEKILGTCSYSASGANRVLTLLQVPIRPPTDLEMLRYLTEHREQTSFPNAALVLTDAEADRPSDQHAVWIHYAYLDRALRPTPILTGAVTPASRPDEAYVVLSQSISWDVSLSVFLVNLGKPISHFPIELDPKKIAEWPQALPPVSHFNKRLIDKEISGIREIKAIGRGDKLSITGERERASTPTVTFEFTPQSGEWKQLDGQISPR